MTPELKERDTTAQIKGFLESRGWYGVRLQSGVVRGITRNSFMRLGKKGITDWIFVRAREALFVEVKRSGAKLSKDQERWHEWAAIQGFLAIWADGLGTFMEKYQKVIGLR